MKIVINRCYGGFGLSREAFHLLRGMGQKDAQQEPDIGECWNDGSGLREAFLNSFCGEIPRNDPMLVEVVEKLGAAANAKMAKLKIVNIPDDVDWKIEEYDGMEHVREISETWS